jgi:chaperonin GroES
VEVGEDMEMMQPTGTKVLVKPILAEEKTQAGIFLPQTAPERASIQAEVIAVGAGRRLPNGTHAPIGVEPGQTVILRSHEQVEVRKGEDTYLLVDERDLLGVVE